MISNMKINNLKQLINLNWPHERMGLDVFTDEQLILNLIMKNENSWIGYKEHDTLDVIKEKYEVLFLEYKTKLNSFYSLLNRLKINREVEKMYKVFKKREKFENVLINKFNKNLKINESNLKRLSINSTIKDYILDDSLSYIEPVKILSMNEWKINKISETTQKIDFLKRQYERVKIQHKNILEIYEKCKK